MPPESEEKQNEELEPSPSPAEDIESLKNSLAEQQKKAEEYLASWQRAQADYLNYKRRTEQESRELCQYATMNLIVGLLPVLDDLERALDSVPAELVKVDWINGIRLVDRKLRAIFEAQGLKPIPSVGEPFDPKLHEAIRMEKGKEGIIIQEFQKGYTLNDKLLRPASVIVGGGDGKKEPEENKEV
jgi:molecular chaperone GrpE